MANLLTYGQATIETATNLGWQNENNATVTRTTSVAAEGAYSLSVVAAGAGTLDINSGYPTPMPAVVAGQTYTALASLRHLSGTGRSWGVQVQYYDSGKAFISGQYSAGSTSSTSFVQEFSTLVAPVGAAYALLKLTVSGAASGQTFYIDKFALMQGSTTTWLSPLTTVGDTQDSAWNTRAAVADSQDTLWNVLSSVTDSQDGTWNTRAVVTDSQDGTWNTLTSVTDSADATWNLAYTFSDTQDTSWNVLTSTTDSADLTWTVLASVADSQDSTWNALALITDNQVSTWDTEAEGSTVTSSVDSLWNIRQVLTDSQDSTWDTISTVDFSVDTSWNVLKITTDSVDLWWSVSMLSVSKSADSTWGVGIIVNKDVESTWNARVTASKALLTHWNVSEVVGDTQSSLWAVQTTTTDSSTSTWNAQGRVTDEVLTNWKVKVTLGDPDISLPLGADTGGGNLGSTDVDSTLGLASASSSTGGYSATAGS